MQQFCSKTVSRENFISHRKKPEWGRIVKKKKNEKKESPTHERTKWRKCDLVYVSEQSNKHTQWNKGKTLRTGKDCKFLFPKRKATSVFPCFVGFIFFHRYIRYWLTKKLYQSLGSALMVCFTDWEKSVCLIDSN